MTRWLFGLVLTFVLFFPTVLGAESADRDRALEIAHEGVELYNHGRFVDAYERFERAEALVHSPAFILYMARARRNQGKLVAAVQLYEHVLDEVLSEDAPDAWRKAVRDAKDELPALRQRVPALRINLGGATGATVWLDGVPLQSARLTDPIPVDPGTHDIVGKRGTEPPVRQQIQVPEGAGETTVELRLGPALPPMGEGEPAPSPEAPVKKRSKGMIIGGGIMGGLGGLSLLMGVSLGVPALVASGTAVSDTTDTLGYAAIGLLAGGAVIGGVGLTLVILGMDTSPDERSAALHVTPGWTGITGSF
ncbi:MAG: hypothetical protein JRI68_16070 [Deltaproteobacteria bacterium]|nr:hypothetical protein [Deltaproteobacteria bacterium]